MALELADLKHLNAAQGFAALGMYEDANAELEEIDPFCRALPQVLMVRLGIYRGAEKWELMQAVARKLAQHDPGEAGWFVDWAYATRRAESIAAAKVILDEAAKRFPEQTLIHYNLACYDCQLDDMESAKKRLEHAFELKPEFRLIALDDPDLEPLWAALQVEW